MKKILGILFLSTFLGTCTYDVYNPDICFQEDVLPIFVTKCGMSGCHNSASHEDNFDLTNYDGIMRGIKPGHPYQSKIFNEIRGAHPSMPPDQPLSAQEVTYIKIWIKMGAKNTSNCKSCDTSAYTYSGRIRPIIDTWCTGCHNPTSTGGGYDFTSYAGIVGAVSAGRLLGSVQHASGYIAMPQSGPKLSDCDVNAIDKWIATGYPEN